MQFLGQTYTEKIVVYKKFTLDCMSCILSGHPTPSRDFTRWHLGERALSVKRLKEPVGRSFGKMADSNFSNQHGHSKTPKAPTPFHPCPHSTGISVSPKGPPALPAPSPFWLSCLPCPRPPPGSWRSSLGFLEAAVILCSRSCPPWLV